MKIKILSPYKSLKDFEPIDLPSFSVITGPNGSGKSQLIEAIQNGKVAVYDGARIIAHIKTISPPSHPLSTTYWRDSSSKRRAPTPYDGGLVAYYEYISKQIPDRVWEAPNSIRATGISKAEFLAQSEYTMNTIIDNTSLKDDLLNLVKSANSVHNNPVRTADNMAERAGIGIKSICQKYGSLFNIPPEDISIIYLPLIDTFSMSLSNIFGKYGDLYIDNLLKKISDDPDVRDSYLNDNDFYKLYGKEPWGVFNNIIESSGMPYRLDIKKPYDRSKFDFKISRTIDGSDVGFDDLSSGEKLIFSLICSSFQTKNDIAVPVMPELALMDELDSPLHPRMVSYLINTIKSGFVDRLGMKCILVTHSPTTVALAPDNSTFEMLSGKLRPISKQSAINNLIVGIPTLDINPDSRKFVFVEDKSDVEIFELLFNLPGIITSPETRFSFISASQKTSNGTTGGGCALVKNIVKSLREKNCRNIYGIIDWDGVNECEDGLLVIGENSRYSIENIVLDPLIFGLFLIRHNKCPTAISDINDLSRFNAFTIEERQRIADCIQDAIFPGTEKTIARYCDNSELNISKNYLELNGHEVEEKIRRTFPGVLAFANNKMKLTVIQSVVSQNPGYVPIEVKNAYQKLVEISSGAA